MSIQAVDHASTSSREPISAESLAPAASFDDVLDAVGAGWMRRAGLSAILPAGQIMQANTAPAQTVPTSTRAEAKDEQDVGEQGDDLSTSPRGESRARSSPTTWTTAKKRPVKTHLASATAAHASRAPGICEHVGKREDAKKGRRPSARTGWASPRW